MKRVTTRIPQPEYDRLDQLSGDLSVGAYLRGPVLQTALPILEARERGYEPDETAYLLADHVEMALDALRHDDENAAYERLREMQRLTAALIDDQDEIGPRRR